MDFHLLRAEKVELDEYYAYTHFTDSFMYIVY